MTTAFDVAAAFLERAPKESLNPIKLQKLTFYAFGWYAKVTGSELFQDRLVVMKHGPVVSDLLNVHSGNKKYSLQDLQDAVEFSPLDDVYAEAVVDAVWATYGTVSDWNLVEMTHLEDPWIQVMDEAKKENKGSKTLPSKLVVDYFMQKSSASYSLPNKSVHNMAILGLLPDPMALELSEGDFEKMELEEQEVPASAFSHLPNSLRSLLASF